MISKDGKTSFSANNADNDASAKAAGKNSTALGYGAEATAENTTAIGNKAKATAKNATALGQNSQATAENSVALGTNSVANEANTVSVGSVDNERRITNVAHGVKGTDAVNVNQLNEVKRDIRKTDKKLRAGIAGVTAMANIPQVTQAGANLVGVGVGNFKGENAIAVGYSKLTDNNKVIFKVSGAANTRGDYNVGAGIGYQWK
ncbi:YadA family autotransporter adhesin [Rodentibacter haemolyticus]|uniref:YadA-like family protein n=1 Tax=Rodentibacter haemolyticus TaxID=2778911 RepID=A0ABX6V652_9PAST|nr:YadA-like family protein [Rodentibacter haemolyticus]QPB43746.1 YadA-like family protein [Rodentibacter haemolyticus]